MILTRSLLRLDMDHFRRYQAMINFKASCTNHRGPMYRQQQISLTRLSLMKMVENGFWFTLGQQCRSVKYFLSFDSNVNIHSMR